MTTRKELYAMGLPLGDCATHKKPGGHGIIYGMGGGGGSSSSSADTTQTTVNTDKRLVVDGGSVGISNDGGTLSYTNASTNYTTDAGAVEAGKSVALAAVSSNSTNTDHLLAAAEHLFTQQQKSLDANVELTGKLAGTAQTAYADASAQASGNKNLILAGMAVVAVVAFKSFGK